MDKINLLLTNQEKITVGIEFAENLLKKYNEIECIYIFGSTVRGDSLPISDLDMHFLLAKKETTICISKQIYKGVFIDIEGDYKENISEKNVFRDRYLFGLFKDSIVIHDKTGYITNLINTIRKKSAGIDYYEQSRGIIPSLDGNLNNFRSAVENKNYCELCRESGFFMWNLSDYLLARNGRPAGGFRTLARLKMLNNDAFIDILKIQESIDKNIKDITLFLGLLSEPLNLNKIEWMLNNGFKDEAFQAIWINFGLEIKEAKDKTDYLKKKCHQWLTLLGWDNKDILLSKYRQMKEIRENYVGKHI